MTDNTSDTTQRIVGEWLAAYDPTPAISFTQSEHLQQLIGAEIERLRKALDVPPQIAVDAFRMDQAQGRSLQSSLAKAFKAAIET